MFIKTLCIILFLLLIPRLYLSHASNNSLTNINYDKRINVLTQNSTSLYKANKRRNTDEVNDQNHLRHFLGTTKKLKRKRLAKSHYRTYFYYTPTIPCAQKCRNCMYPVYCVPTSTFFKPTTSSYKNPSRLTTKKPNYIYNHGGKNWIGPKLGKL